MKYLKSGISIVLMLGTLALSSCTRGASETTSEASSLSERQAETTVEKTVSEVEKTSTVTKTPVKNPQGRGKVWYNFFDTVSYIYSYAGDSDELFNERTDSAADILYEYHKLFDIYYEYSGVNNLRTINLNAGGDPIKVDQKLIDFLLYAKELYGVTKGEMNIMMGSVLSIWHDARTAKTPYLPDRALLEEAYRHTSWESLEIDEENGTVRLLDPKASIDVGALGKGYATEMAGRYLEEIGATSYVLNIGGNIRIVGTKLDGSGWRTGIKDPKNPDNAFKVELTIADCACVTSGSYEKYFVLDGVRYNHVIDRDTLAPAVYFDSLTIITDDSGLADALSTALFCMSYEDGLELTQSLGNVDVIWIFRDGSVKYTKGIESRINK
ncbi:MAG: FAD:protein FMN transferase [Spirochaetales bacterium]|nr:FAD:protein FMN transferase [Candidatus Physcosoma equi]